MSRSLSATNEFGLAGRSPGATRRTFLKAAVAGLAGVPLLKPLLAASEVATSLNYGYISGIVGEELKRDWSRVLAQSARYGFTEIEIGRPPEGVTAEAFLERCRELGIKPVAGGVSMTEDAEILRERLDSLKALELRYAVAYWPWFVSAPFSLTDCQRSARVLNEMGALCQDEGLTLCWHNHADEFVPMEEGLPFDYLMNETDPNLVKCELDVYWARKGGADPVGLLRRYEGRYAILHLKDMTADASQTFECVGAGVIDFPAILKEARRQGMRHFMVEHDKVKDGLACLESSGAYLQSLDL